MKDNAVEPAVLFDVHRQRRLLDGMINRFRGCHSKQQILQSAHAQQKAIEEAELSRERAIVANDCRIQRRNMLQTWERAEERLVRKYESNTITVRRDLNRLAAMFRKKSQEEQQIIERKVAARRQAILHQYENRKNQPGQQNRKEMKLIEESIEPIRNMVAQARDLALRRLDTVPEVGPAESSEDDFQQPEPESIEDAVSSIRTLTGKCQQVVDEMHTTTASRIVDSYILPVGVLAFLILWCLVAFIFTGGSVLWMAGGVVPAGIIGFSVYLALMMPLKRTTRRLFPVVERVARAAEDCASAGKKLSTNAAKEASDELIQRRDEHMASTQRWMDEQLDLMNQRLETEQVAERERLEKSLVSNDQSYIENYAKTDHEMRSQADQVANQISSQLSKIDYSLQTKREANDAERAKQMEHLTHRLNKGIRLGAERMIQSSESVFNRYPQWTALLGQTKSEERTVDFLPLGWLKIDDILRAELKSESTNGKTTENGSAVGQTLPEVLPESQLPQQIPVGLHRRLYSAVVIHCSAGQMSQAVDLTHALLWRLLTGAPPARAKLTLIDPVGRGQHFTSFMALADHDPSIVNHRVWTTDSNIDVRLSELAHHVEDVLQSSLRDRFQRIEDYNQVAGSMAEPYRAIAAVGLPEGLSRSGYGHLNALIESGLRCGVFTILVCDKDKPWSTDMPIPNGEKVLELEISEAGSWRLKAKGLEQLPFEPIKPPPPELRDALINQIGSEAVSASRVEIPLHDVLSAAEEGKGSTDDGVSIVVGSQGANRSLALQLGEGVRQHVLIAGKTGSGKSTLLHSIISSGAHYYRPDQLQFYLLDFKKGVEFKPYADLGLPHARVIGIESEREFGRSVLQRLDQELSERGEKFRLSGAQTLADHRRKSGDSLPRIMLVIDEFQELFVRDDRIAGDCTMLLDRLVRQGRSFGIHVILSSQSLAGAYSLPRATLGQMAVRIAMQCSESDATLILSDENTAARLISRPGEAIYNDAGGLIEGNQPFQVAWLSADRHREMLGAIAARDQSYLLELDPPVIFEGNRPCRWTAELAESATSNGSEASLRGLLGESVAIGPPLSLELSRDTGRNVLMITSPSARQAVLASMITGMAKQASDLEVVYFDGSRGDDEQSAAPWIEQTGIQTRIIPPRDCERVIAALSQMIKDRDDQSTNATPIVVVVDPLERFRDFRQDESFNFSLDSAANDSPTGGASLQSLLRDGPAAGIHLILICGSAETLSRWLPRASQHDLELRILGQMNQSDSSQLIDSPAAADLSAATLLLYDDSDGRTMKFRQCELPKSEDVKKWLDY